MPGTYHKPIFPNNYYNQTISSGISSGDLTIPVSAPPTESRGVLVLEPTSATKREIIYYTSKDATNVYCPSWGRGLGGTTATDHSSGARIVDAPTSVHFAGLIQAVLEGFRPTDFAASYGSASTIVVSTDVTSEATAGRVLRIKFATTGIRYFTIQSSSFSTPNTTITLTGDTVVNEVIDYVDIDLSRQGNANDFAAEHNPNGTHKEAAVSTTTNSAASKTTPVDGDLIPLVDSAASNVLKKLTWANLKATLKTYFDTLYSAGGDWIPYATVVPTLASATKDKYTLTFAGVDLTSMISVGKRVKLTQTDGTNTQSLDLESGSSQYASKTDSASLSITGAITIEAWIKLESLAGVGQTIAAKWYQDGNLKSYIFYVNSDNRTLRFDYAGDGFNESGLASGNCISQADIGRWIHVAVVCVPSTKTVTFYKNGELVSSGTASGSQTAIHDNTSTFAVGARDIQGTPDTFFDGKICEVKLWSTNRTQAQIQGDMFHNLAGNESNLAGYWKLDNSYSDATANANNLSASGSPVFSADVPAKLTNNVKYGIVTSISYSTNTSMQVMMGSEYGVDTGTISDFNYSPFESPVGFPVYMNYHSEGPTGCSISSRFTTYGRTVDVVIWGAATGAMDWSSMPSLPIAVGANTNAFDADSTAHGVGGYLDSGTVNNVDGLSPCVGPNDTTVRIVGSDTSSIVSATSPITWAVNDTWYIHFTYEF